MPHELAPVLIVAISVITVIVATMLALLPA
jgi:hypothetical protein